MARLKCKKCGNVFEYTYKPLDSIVHVGPYKRIQCPACGKSSFFNVYPSVSDSVTWPAQEQGNVPDRRNPDKMEVNHKKTEK